MSFIIDWFQVHDYILFQKINKEWNNPFNDFFFPLITDLHQNKIFVFFVLPVLLIWWLYRDRAIAFKTILGLALVVGLTDNFNHRIMKPEFERKRPIESGMDPILRSPTNSGSSFPSNHAANIFAAANFFVLYYPGSTFWVWFLAALVAYSRVYVGAHFPLDVLAGAIVGLIISSLVKIIWNYFGLRRNVKKRTNEFESSRAREQIFDEVFRNKRR